jgi:hypothetical protein
MCGTVCVCAIAYACELVSRSHVLLTSFCVQPANILLDKLGSTAKISDVGTPLLLWLGVLGICLTYVKTR